MTDKNVIGFVADQITDDVQAQMVRDLLILSGEWDIFVSDPGSILEDALLDQLGLSRDPSPPTLMLVYKTGDIWPTVETDVPVVKRDLKPDDCAPTLDGREQVGYYLAEQGRDGANRTEQFLNRAYPKGKGLVNPLVTLTWG